MTKTKRKDEVGDPSLRRILKVSVNRLADVCLDRKRIEKLERLVEKIAEIF